MGKLKLPKINIPGVTVTDVKEVKSSAPDFCRECMSNIKPGETFISVTCPCCESPLQYHHKCLIEERTQIKQKKEES